MYVYMYVYIYPPHLLLVFHLLCGVYARPTPLIMYLSAVFRTHSEKHESTPVNARTRSDTREETLAATTESTATYNIT